MGKIVKMDTTNSAKTVVEGTSALKAQPSINTSKNDNKVKVLKKVYEKPKARVVGMSTQKSPVMGCWDCGEDGMHC